MNDKQKRFVAEYLIDLNATEAAKRAGYKASTAYSQGQRLLKHVEVAAAITEAQQKREIRTGITADRVLQELARLGLSDVRKLFTEGGNLLPPQAWGDDMAAAVAAIEVVSRSTGEKDADGATVVEHVHKVKLWDKNSALEKIAKHLGMFVERHEHTGANGAALAFAVQFVGKNAGD